MLGDRSQADALALEVGRLSPPAWVEAQGEMFRVLASPTDSRVEIEKAAERMRTNGYEVKVIDRRD